MALIDVGAGAAGGLETLLARIRADEELKQRQSSLDETVRSNKANESLRAQTLSDSLAARLAAQQATDQTRKFGQAEKRMSGYVDDQSVPRNIAMLDMQATGDQTRFSEPNQTVRPTPSVMPLIGAPASGRVNDGSFDTPGQQTPSVPEMKPQPVTKLTEPSPTLNYVATGQQKLADRRIADTEARTQAAANKETPPNSEAEKQKAVGIRMRVAQNDPSVTPAERAWLKAHEAEATLGPALTASAADARSADTLVRVEHKNADGKTVIEYIPRNELGGQQFDKGDNATLATRLSSAKAVLQTGNDMIKALSDPKLASQLGPALGRYNTVADFVGNPPPEFANLAGLIESYSLANMGVHGMRSANGAEAIKATLGAGRHTPQTIIAIIEGLNGFANHLMENEGQSATGRPVAGNSKRIVYDANGNPIKQ